MTKPAYRESGISDNEVIQQPINRVGTAALWTTSICILPSWVTENISGQNGNTIAHSTSWADRDASVTGQLCSYGQQFHSYACLYCQWHLTCNTHTHIYTHTHTHTHTYTHMYIMCVCMYVISVFSKIWFTLSPESFDKFIGNLSQVSVWTRRGLLAPSSSIFEHGQSQQLRLDTCRDTCWWVPWPWPLTICLSGCHDWGSLTHSRSSAST